MWTLWGSVRPFITINTVLKSKEDLVKFDYDFE